MTLDLTEEETAALARLLTNTIDADRYPLSPRIELLKGILAKSGLVGTPTAPRAEALRATARWPIPQTWLVKSDPGPPLRRHFVTPKVAHGPMMLGNAAAASGR